MTAHDLGERIDGTPTHLVAGHSTRIGKPFPFGATVVNDGVNFSVYSAQATAMTLVLFDHGAQHPKAEIQFPDEFRIGSVFCMTVFGLDYENLDYGFRAEGPFDPGRGLRFDASRVLSDPYARLVSGRDVWGAEPDWSDVYPYRSRVLRDDFDWEQDLPLRHPGRGPGHLRDARARLHPRPVLRGLGSRHLRRPARKNPLPARARGQLRRALADLRIRRIRQRQRPTRRPASGCSTLGLQHRRLLRAEGRLCRDRPSRNAGR